MQVSYNADVEKIRKLDVTYDITHADSIKHHYISCINRTIITHNIKHENMLHEQNKSTNIVRTQHTPTTFTTYAT